jgi:uncharacterized protein (TIGR02678 family)
VSGDPHGATEARQAARHLLQFPLTCAEHDPETFRLIRRHTATLDRWFTQRFGDRVHVDADTARLYKSVSSPAGRPLRAPTGRPLRPVEYVMLALALGAVASGPDVISLRDLVAAVRSAAAEAEIEMSGDAPERRALVVALQWMIAQGLLSELHDRVERYSADEQADAVLRVRADRVALVALPGLADARSASDLLERAEARGTPRQQMRAHLANDPVLYRSDLPPEQWAELRRRLGEEASILDEVLGLELEARAEGVAAIDAAGTLSDRRFPSGGTESHAALLLVDRLVELRVTGRADNHDPAGEGSTEGAGPVEHKAGAGPPGKEGWVSQTEVVELVADLSAPHRRRWRAEYADDPGRLASAVIDLLTDLRLIERADEPACADGSWRVRLLPAAARFTTAEEPLEAQGLTEPSPGSGRGDEPVEQASLW